MPYCKSCGAERANTQKFCNQCGHPQFGDIPEITWTGKAKLTNNPQMYRAYLIMLGIAFVIGLLLSLATGNFFMLIMFLIIMAALIGLFLLASILTDWVSDGGTVIQGIVNAEGVAHQVGEGTRTLNRGYLLFGILSVLGGGRGGLTTLGGSLLATSQESNSISWNDVTSVKVYPRNRLIILRDMTIINGVALYCTEDNFDRVLDVIRKRVPKDATFS
jgi:hypothetical protein